MIDKYQRDNGQIFAVIPANGEYHVINCGQLELERVEHIASYSDKWRAENHAIAGCPCTMNWHYYHGKKHEPLD